MNDYNVYSLEELARLNEITGMEFLIEDGSITAAVFSEEGA